MGNVIITLIITAIGSALLGGIFGGLLVRTEHQIRSLQRQLDELKNLPKRHTYSTAAGLEDAIAVLIDIRTRRHAEDIRLSQATEILRQVRSGPQNYDQDRPAGKRPEGFGE